VEIMFLTTVVKKEGLGWQMDNSTDKSGVLLHLLA
jgi:hypothetical protein